MVENSDASPFMRLDRELVELTRPQQAELEWRSMMRLMSVAQGSVTAPGLVDTLRRLLVARLFMDGQLDAAQVQAVAVRPITHIPPSSASGRSTGVGSHAARFLRYLSGEDDHSGSATQEAAAQRGLGVHVRDGDPVLDDIRQIKASAREPWGKVHPLSFEDMPRYIVAGKSNPPVSTQGKVHPFWAQWYQQVIDDRPPNWPLLRDVALIDEAVWQAGGEVLDRAIDAVLQDHALAATANGETIEVNPDTGKLRLAPASDLPEDMARYVRRKILKAVDLFPQPLSQSHGALAPDLAMLSRAVEDAGNLPVELYDACSSALTRLARWSQLGECPAVDDDPLLSDYRDRLRDAAADILGSDAEARRVLERRQALAGNDALINGRDAIVEVAAQVLPLLEGRLADTLPEDADTATDPNAPPAERKAASYRFVSRFLRISKQIGKGFIAGSKALVGVASYLQTMEFLAKSPVAQEAIRTILSCLGLG